MHNGRKLVRGRHRTIAENAAEHLWPQQHAGLRDDLATVVTDMSVLTRVARAFDVFGRASAMHLPADRRVLVPLSLNDDEAGARDGR